MMDVLPDDMVANILNRLPPCSLAVSRCVCNKWCAVVDTRRLLRADLLPLRLDGFFFRAEIERVDTYFFASPSTGRRIGGCLTDFLDRPVYDTIMDHCNGLLLLWERVANPATRQSAHLPPFPEPCVEGFHRKFFLAYDPIISPQHYEVILIPIVPQGEINDIKFKEESEWPPSTFTTHVFSSTKWRWEERSFVREGEAAGTIADMHYDWETRHHHAIYLRGALYVHCHNGSVMRITLSRDKYRMIKSPAENKEPDTYLGKSEKGVYYAALSQGCTWPRFRVWLLNESCDQIVWVLKIDTNLQAMVDNFHIDYNARHGTPWIVNYIHEDVSEACAEDESERDFDGGIVLREPEDKVATYYSDMIFLGFHPYKEIAFFVVSSTKVVSYHLNSSKVQELGSLRQPVDRSFPYTACWMRDLLSEKK
ncbi:hypothetical protein EJB05_08279 [Eragrostis curvula]|uniref:F-box domain-containing protein n=1 Tax=Eragrostis curvula TaxID=38414 RepID=A0A5J9WK67_9POAL|nr:hypothetical protein EJB05_08279 [Eragrostis curvula]